MIVSAWIMGLIISTPMYIDAPGFSNLNHDITIDNGSVNCMPPVSKHAGCLKKLRKGNIRGNLWSQASLSENLDKIELAIDMEQ